MNGFGTAEFQHRLARAQSAMATQGHAALLLTTEADVRYLTGFLTRFWESPTRPWFVIVPAQGDVIAVIPSIGAALMAQTWVRDIRTWRAPNPGDDGVTLLHDTLHEVAGRAGPIAVPMGLESHLRMPLQDWTALQQGLIFTDDGGLMRDLRAIKSDAEVAKIETACAIAGRAFSRVSEIARGGVALDQVFRDFQRLALEEGADWVPYLAGGADQDGYGDVISPASTRALATGDVLMLDTGLVHDGYFCDFDRNFALGRPSQAVQNAYHALIDAVDRAAEVARPGATAADLFHVMDGVLSGGGEAGRLGHGLGLQLTEGLSLIPQDLTELRPGMVLTLEPGIEVVPGKIMVHEENIVITQGAPRFLSPRAPRDIPQLKV
ncbi:MAG: M24 family metallopeptidase [Sedimentitalea sp.]